MGDGRGADGGSSFPQVKGKYVSKHVETEGMEASNGEGGESEGTGDEGISVKQGKL